MISDQIPIEKANKREIEIKNGIVLIDNHEFSQKSFFHTNVIYKKIS